MSSDTDGMGIYWHSDTVTAVGSSVAGEKSLSPAIDLCTDDEADGSDSTQQHVQITTCDGVFTFSLLVGFDTFWHYSSERQQIENRRREGQPPPWTEDRILQANKFTSIFRIADRGTQFLISEVIEKGSQDPEEILYRVLLFSTFMKIETYQLLEREFGPLTWARFDAECFAKKLKNVLRSGPIYTGAFQKHAPKLGESTEHENHLKLLQVMMEDDMCNHLKGCKYMADAFDTIHRYPSFADFMSFQLLINLSYTPLLPFNENDFVIAGVGAVKGLAKCFAPEDRARKYAPSIIRWMMETQDEHFARLGLEPAKLRGPNSQTRPMSLVDVEHTLCELHKYITARARGSAKARFVAPDPAASRGRGRRALALYPKQPEAWSDPRRKEVRIKLGRSDRERPQKVYVVSKILDHEEGEDGEVIYFVDWLGYGPEARTWESESTLKADIPKMVAAYREAHLCVSLDDELEAQMERVEERPRPRKRQRKEDVC